MSVPPPALRWVARAVGPGAVVTGVHALAGGGLHAVHAVDVEVGGAQRSLVLRRWARRGWERTDGEFDVARETTALELLADSAVPAPRVVAADPAGHECGAPALLLTRLPGNPPAGLPDLEALAALLSELHGVEGASVLPAYRRYTEPARLAPPPWARERGVWERAIALADGPPPTVPACLIHRDFHPGNTLWKGGRLTGVVDWSYASCGPAAVDAGHLRWNLAVAHGPEAADRLLGVPGVERHRHWDLVCALDAVADLDPAQRPALERWVARLVADES
jgi:aminoglycoside phosphotransferase (APT) family kinase protein